MTGSCWLSPRSRRTHSLWFSSALDLGCSSLGKLNLYDRLPSTSLPDPSVVACSFCDNCISPSLSLFPVLCEDSFHLCTFFSRKCLQQKRDERMTCTKASVVQLGALAGEPSIPETVLAPSLLHDQVVQTQSPSLPLLYRSRRQDKFRA